MNRRSFFARRNHTEPELENDEMMGSGIHGRWAVKGTGLLS
jgi:hypothetical protein